MIDTPRTVYRVISKEDWETAQRTGIVPRCGADERDGFVHLSTSDTMLETANLYFQPEEAPLIVEVLTQALGEALLWELVVSRGNQHFPHLYAEGIHCEAISALIELELDSNEGRTFKLGTRRLV